MITEYNIPRNIGQNRFYYHLPFTMKRLRLMARRTDLPKGTLLASVKGLGFAQAANISAYVSRAQCCSVLFFFF